MTLDCDNGLYDFTSQIINEYYLIEALCIIGQLIISMIATFYIKLHWNQYPLKQNSNLITLIIIWSFFMCNIILMVGRVVIEQHLDDNGKQFFQESSCFWYITGIPQLAYAYVFFSQIIIPAICLKMFRVSIAYFEILYNQVWLIKIMKNTLYITIIIVIWTSVFTFLEIIFDEQILPKAYNFNTRQRGGIQLYQFFCSKYPAQLPQNTWLVQMIKMILSIAIYLVQYYFSFIIDKAYSFKSQYNSQLIIYLIPLVSRNILDLNSISNLITWYQTQIFMYFLNSLTICWYHRTYRSPGNTQNIGQQNIQYLFEGAYYDKMTLFRTDSFQRFYQVYLKNSKSMPMYSFMWDVYNKSNQISGLIANNSCIDGDISNFEQAQKLINQLHGYLMKFEKQNQKIVNRLSEYNTFCSKLSTKCRQIEKLFQKYHQQLQNQEIELNQSQDSRLRQTTEGQRTVKKIISVEIQTLEQIRKFHESILQIEFEDIQNDPVFTYYTDIIKQKKYANIKLHDLNIPL